MKVKLTQIGLGIILDFVHRQALQIVISCAYTLFMLWMINSMAAIFTAVYYTIIDF